MAKEMTYRAEALRKRRQYGEAAALYEAAWQKEASPYVARWLIYCRRKTGDLDGAEPPASPGPGERPPQPGLHPSGQCGPYPSQRGGPGPLCRLPP